MTTSPTTTVLVVLLLVSLVAGEQSSSATMWCTVNTTVPKLTWCQYNNPFILSDFLSRNSTELTERVEETQSGGGGTAENVTSDDEGMESFQLSINCYVSLDSTGTIVRDGDGTPQSTCTAISQIRSATIGIPELPAQTTELSLGGLIQPQGMTGNRITRFVIFTDLDGRMLFVHFNENTMAKSIDVTVENVRFFDTAATQHLVMLPVQDGGATEGGVLKLRVNQAANLRNVSLVSNPYAVVSNISGNVVLTTEVISDSLNPVWPNDSEVEMILPGTTPGSSTIELQVLDHKNSGASDAPMGGVLLRVGDLANDLGGTEGGTKTYALPLKDLANGDTNLTGHLGTIEFTATYTPTPVMTSVQDLTMLIANATGIALVDINGLDPSLVHTCYIIKIEEAYHIAHPQRTLNLAEFFPKEATGPESLKSLLWIWQVTDLPAWTRTHNLTPEPWMSHYSEYLVTAVPMRQDTIHDYIHTCPQDSNKPGVQFKIYSQNYAQFKVHHNVVSNMTFLFAYTKKAVGMFRIDYEGDHFENNRGGIGFELPAAAGLILFEWCAPHTLLDTDNNEVTWNQQQSTIYCAPNEGTEITTVGVMSPESFEGIFDYANDLFLTIGLKNATGIYAHTMDLQELVNLNQTSKGSTLGNPLDLPESFGTVAYPCHPATEFYDTKLETCRPRYSKTVKFEGGDAITGIEAVSIAGKKAVEDDNKNETSSSTTSSSDLPSSLTGASTTSNSSYTAASLTDTLLEESKVSTADVSHVLIYIARRRTVEIFSMYSQGETSSPSPSSSSDDDGGSGGSPAQGNATSLPQLALQRVNQIHFLGQVSWMHISPNGQHLFTAVSRQEWELNSQRRFLDICNQLKANPSDAFLQPFQSSCDSFPAQEVNLNSFTQYASVCSTLAYCPYLDEQVAQLPPQGYYADRPAVLKPCPAGYFCDVGQKQECPPGFYCPEEGLSSPLRCPEAVNYNTTCAEYGQIAPKLCADGKVCMVSHIPGLPAPPGYMVPKAPAVRTQMLSCPAGWWCNLGIQQPYNNSFTGKITPYPESTIYCPSNTFCTNSSILQPQICQCDSAGQIPSGNGTMIDCEDRTLYCPPKTTTASWCAAGFYCTKPTISVPCIETQYCPPGTFAPELCPAGYFCEKPDKKIICPAGSYCQRGSLAPIPCNYLTLCPEGSATQSRSFLTPFVLLTVVIGLSVGFYLFTMKIRRDNAIVSAIVSTDAALILLPETQEYLLSGSTRAPTTMDMAEEEECGTGIKGSRKGEEAAAAAAASSLEMGTIDHSTGKPKPKIPISRFATPNITFEGMGLELKVGDHKGKNVLDDVTGEIPPGSFVAVMGPSGSGKSTFMHTLAGKAFYGKRLGHVYVNGEEVSLTEFRKVTGFVKQDDIMLREMTVGETLAFNAKMRHDPQCAESPMAIAKSMLKVLDLNHVKDVNIGDETKRGISGGQRKRVNIGMEMCALPCILFLDEPTSGLDSSSSMTVCQALRDMADAGITVIAVIHQPRYEIFNMFHKVMLLAKGGKLVYYGDPQEAMPYFENDLGLKCPPHVNPPDFFMDSISGDVLASAAEGTGSASGLSVALTVDQLQEKWQNSPRNKLPPLIAHKRRMAWDTTPSTPSAPCSPPSNSTKKEKEEGEGEQALLAGNERLLNSGGEIGTWNVGGEEGGAALASRAGRKEVAGFFSQLLMFTNRCLIQQSRDLVWFFTDLLLVLVSGFFLGLVFSKSEYLPPLPAQIINQSLSSFGNSPPEGLREFLNRPVDDPIISEASLTCMAIGMTGVTAALRVFGNEQIVYWREASAGMSTTAYFLAKNLTHVLFIVLSPLLYLAPFLTFVSARASLTAYYQICVILQFSTTGLGYLISVVTPPGLAQLVGVVVVLVFSMFGGARPTLMEIQKMFPLLHAMPYLSYVRWGQEAIYLNEIREWNKVQGVNVAASLELFGYSFDDYDTCVWVCLGYGVLFRVMALLAMMFLNRHQKQ